MNDPTRTHDAPDTERTAPTADEADTRGPAAGGPGGATDADGFEFDLIEEIGRGGMGVVYRAADRALRREVAVKVLSPKYAVESSTAARFLDEARITGQLQHPGIPPVYRMGRTTDGRPYLAMKLIKGRTLQDLLSDGAVDRLGVFEGVCQAVGYAHAHGVIHRDLKPHNVMVGSFGEVQVMDWGLAKILAYPERQRGGADESASTEIRTDRESGGSFTLAGSVMGTPAYMSPEQAAGETGKIDARSDVFGLGAILCALLTGQPPFVGKDADSVRVAAMRGQTAEAFARLDGCGADPGVVALAKRCLSFEPADRPADGGAVAAVVADLRRAADERARRAEVSRATAEVAAGEQRKRRRVIEWAAAAVLVALTAGVVVSLWQAKRAMGEAANARSAEQNAEQQLIAANDAYALSRESLVQVGGDLPEVLRQAIYTRDARMQANQVLADALARQLDPTAVRGLPGRAKLVLHIRSADVLTELGKRKEAEEGYRAALEISTALLAAGGEEAALAKGNHALVLSRLAVAERDAKLTAEAANAALVQLAEVEKLQRELVASPPPGRPAVELRQSLAVTLLDVATTRRMLQQNDAAVGPCREAIDLLRPRPDDPPATRYTRDRQAKLAAALSQFGKIHTARQDDPAAEAAFKEAAAVAADVSKSDPKNPVYRLTAARAAREYGDFLLMRNRLAEAEPLYARDAAAFRHLLNTGELTALKFEHGDSYYRGATLALKRDDKKAAAALYARCRGLWADVTEANPTTRNKLALGLVQARLGDHAAAAVFARQLLADGKYTAGDGIQAVSVLALCGGAADGDARKQYLDESLAGLTVLVGKLGYKNVARLKTDPDLDPLRGEPAFQAVIMKLDTPKK